MQHLLTNWVVPIASGWEILSRSIPTKGKNLSIIDLVLKGLVLLSGLLNREKPYGNSGRGLPLLFIVIAVSLFSCNAIKNIECKSTKTVPVVFITPTGNYYTLLIPYCDTVLLKNNQSLPDTTKFKTVR